jgi:hypothetical protein
MSRCFPPPPPRREARLSGSEHLGEQAGGTHAEHDRAGRVKVRVDLSVPSHSDIFAVGDTAAVTDQPGIPGTVPPAKLCRPAHRRARRRRAFATAIRLPPDQPPSHASDPPHSMRRVTNPASVPRASPREPSHAEGHRACASRSSRAPSPRARLGKTRRCKPEFRHGAGLNLVRVAGD